MRSLSRGPEVDLPVIPVVTFGEVMMQEIFDVGPFLGDAVNATDLSDLFKPGAIFHGQMRDR